MEVWYLTTLIFALSIWTMVSVLGYEKDVTSMFMRYSNSALIIVGAMCQQSKSREM